DRHAALGQVGLGGGDAVLVVMENARGQGRVGGAGRQRLVDVFGTAGPAAGDDGDADRVGHRPRHLQVVAGLGAVGVHARQHDLAGPRPPDFTGPRAGLQPGRTAPAVDVDLPDDEAVLADAARVDVDHGGAPPELAGHLRHQVGVAHRRRVDADLL